jgi:carbon storage regulator CsrA
MLVLSRKNSESVVVGDPAGRDDEMLKITVIEIGGGTVRLGFEAATNVAVNRWEVWQRIRSGVQPTAAKDAPRHSPRALRRCVR